MTRALLPLPLWLLLALALGCDKPADDDTAGDDDATADDDDTVGDDDSIPEHPCVDLPNPVTLAGTVCATDAACQLSETGTALYLGYDMAAGGDFDGDGIEDLVVGAPGFDVIQDEGRAVIYTIASFEQVIVAPTAYVEGPEPLENTGFSVALAPDIDGDGIDDLLVGARGDGELAEAAGAIYVVHGRTLANDPTAPEALTADTTIRGTTEYSRVGVSSTGIADVTGDGLGEVALGFELYWESSSWEFADDGKVAVFHGQAGGLGAETTVDDADLVFEGPVGSYHVGYALASGDVSGDGQADLLVGAPEANASRGRVYIATGPTLLQAGVLPIEDHTVMVEGMDAGEAMGTAIAIVGDVDGDGLTDFAAGSPESDMNWDDGGAVSIFAGSVDIDTGVEPLRLAQFGSEWDDFGFGTTIAGNADLDGDGLDDVLVGAVYAYLGPVMKGGRAYLFHGRETGWDTLLDATQADAGIAGIGVGDNLSAGAALPDLDGDGYPEVVVAAPYHDATGSDSGELYLFWGTP